MPEGKMGWKHFTDERNRLGNGQMTPTERQQFILNAITVDHEFYGYYLTFEKNDFEDAIEGAVTFFDPKEDTYNLLMIRRFLYRRYAFCVAFDVERKIGRRSLWIDRLLPRLGLSLILGFAGVLGASDLLGWLTSLNPGGTGVFVSACWVLTLSVIYLNVRERVNRARQAFGRACLVWLASLIWAGAYLGGARLMGAFGGIETCQFTVAKAINVGSAAIVIAVLAQFFFSRSGSIADPL